MSQLTALLDKGAAHGHELSAQILAAMVADTPTRDTELMIAWFAGFMAVMGGLMGAAIGLEAAGMIVDQVKIVIDQGPPPDDEQLQAVEGAKHGH